MGNDHTRLDELVDLCIERWKTAGSTAVDEVCQAHPALADRLRERMEILRRTGSLRSMLGREPHSFDGETEVVTRAFEFPFTLDQFEVHEELGRGSTGVVFRARDTVLERDVALKLLYEDLQRDTEHMVRFRDEAKSLAALNHTNVASIYSLEEHGDDTYLVLEHVSGETLADRLLRGGRSYEKLLGWMAQVATALEAAHENGLVHRDLKPANVMVDATDTVKVLDFGLARQTRATGADPVTRFAGTPRYMSPEQWSGAPVEARTDLWALGCILFEALSGCFPFRGTGPDEVRAAVLDEEPIWELLPDAVPHPVRELISSCLQKEPADRPAHARDCAETLQRVVAGLRSEPSLTVQCLRRRLIVGETAAFRVWASNPGSAEIEAELTLDVEEAFAAIEPCSLRLATGDVWHGVLRAVPTETGRLSIPTASLSYRREPGHAPIRSVTTSASLTVEPDTVAPLIGREDLLRQLEDAIDRWAIGDPRVVSIHGGRGTGKTSILQRIERRARARGVRDLRAFGSGGYRQPLKIFHDLLRDLTGTSEFEEDGEAFPRRAEQRLTGYLRHDPDTVDYFVRMLAEEVSEIPNRELREYHWYRLFAAAASDGPVLLCIDDLHEADENTLQLLRGLIGRFRQERQPVGVIATFCPPGDRIVMATSDAFLRPRGESDEVHSLPPLRPRAIERAIRAAYPEDSHGELLPWLPDLIWERTEGNPAFVEEIVGKLGEPSSDLQLFARTGDAWTLVNRPSRSLLASRIPLRFADIIQDQIAALSAFDQDLLATASLVGHEFPIEILARLVDDRDAIDSALDRLAEAQLLADQDRDLTRGRFRSRMVREVARERLFARGRRVAARRCLEIARVAHSQYRDQPEHLEWIGSLFFDGGEVTRASECLRAALHWRTEHGEYADALSISDRLDELHDRTPDLDPKVEIDLDLRRASILAMLGQLEESRESAERALDLACDFDLVRLQARALIQLSELQLRSLQWDDAASSLDRAVTLFDPDDVELAMAALNNRGILHLNCGKLSAARRALEEVLERARNESDRRVEVKALNNLGIVDYREGALDSARENFRRAASLSDRLGSVDHATISRVWLSNVEFERGQLEAAGRGYAEAIARFRMLQNRRGLGRNHGNLALVQRLQGRLDLAVDSAATALRLSREVGDRAHEGSWCLLLADLHDLLGDRGSAEEQIRAAQSIAQSLEDEDLTRRTHLQAVDLGFEPLDPRSTLGEVDDPALRARQLLIELRTADAHSFARLTAEVEAVLPELTVESSPLRTRLVVAAARTLDPVEAGLTRLDAEVTWSRAHTSLDVHRLHRAEIELCAKGDPARAERAQQRFEESLDAAATRIADLEVRRRYVDTERRR